MLSAETLSSLPVSAHIRLMAKTPDRPKKPGKSPKSKAGRPDVQPIGPALAELLNPAINRGDAGTGSSTGLQPPPDNSWDRRAGGEAAAHRARASTRDKSEDVAKRDTRAANDAAFPPRTQSSSPPPRGVRGEQSSLSRSGVGGASNTGAHGLPPSPTLPRKGGGSDRAVQGLDEAPQANYGTAATIPTLDPELARQLGLPTAEDDDEA